MGKVEEKAAGKRTFFLPQGARREFLPTGSIPGVRAHGNPVGMTGRKFWEGKKNKLKKSLFCSSSSTCGTKMQLKAGSALPSAGQLK